jgi:hypothetical protein
MIPNTARTPATRLPESSRFSFTENFEQQEDFYEQMQEEVELTMLRQGHGVRRAPKFNDE